MTSDKNGQGPALEILDGAAAPPDLGRDLLKLLTFSKDAQSEFWRVLGAYLQPVLDQSAQDTVVAFCDQHDLVRERIAPAIKSARFLFHEAARRDAPVAILADDLRKVLDAEDADDLLELVLPWYEDFLPKLRGNMARQAIADHGKVVVGTQWRVDRIGSSSRGRDLNASVAVVTFTYQDGDQTERITLHLLPDQVDALRKSANEMLA